MYDKTILAKTVGVSLGVLALVGLVFLSTGTTFALPVAGIGGFTVEAESIEGDDLVLYPGIGAVEGESEYPLAVVELQGTRIEGLRLTRTLDLGSFTGNAINGRMRLVIEAGGEVQTDQILIRSPGLEAEEATFNGLRIEQTASENLSESFGVRAPSEPVEGRTVSLDGGENPGLVLENASLQASYLATNEITMPDLTLAMQYDADGDGEFEYG